MNELEEIKNRYKRIKKKEKKLTSRFMVNEKESKYFEIISNHFTSFKRLFNLNWSDIYANELLENSIPQLKKNLPNSNIYSGDASTLKFNNYFDVVFQSTVFTSILDYKIKQKLANKCFSMTKNNGLVLWYDFKYNNPKNKDVKGIGKEEIKNLFPNAKKIIFHNVTLAPPIGRIVGKLYPFINFLFLSLRTHIIAEIYK